MYLLAAESAFIVGTRMTLIGHSLSRAESGSLTTYRSQGASNKAISIRVVGFKIQTLTEETKSCSLPDRAFCNCAVWKLVTTASRGSISR